MSTLNKKGWGLFFLIAVILPTAIYLTFKWYDRNVATLPYYGENFQIQDTKPAFKVGGFSFINQDSVMVTNEFVDGKIWVANYFFTTCPTICPAMISGIEEVQEEFTNAQDEVRLVSLTVNPEVDTPPILKAYQEVNNINPNQWQLLTGDKKELYRYARKQLFITATEGTGGPNDFIHSEKLVLIDKDNYIRGYYDGTERSEIKLLINDINRLMKE